MTKLSVKIDHLLHERGWPLRELARRTGFGRERVRRMAMRAPESVLCAIRMAEILDVPVEWLFNDTQDWPPPRKSSGPEGIDLESARIAIRKLIGINP